MTGLFVACSGRRVDPPLSPVALPATFTASGEVPLSDRWWTAFGDPQLDGLVATALAGNFDLLVAWDRLAQLEAIMAREGASRWPGVDGTGGLRRSVDREVVEPAAPQIPRTTTIAYDNWLETQQDRSVRTFATSWSLGLAASYELDVWGRLRAGRQAADLDTRAAEQDLHAAAMTVTAGVTNAWFDVVQVREELAVLAAQTISAERQIANITMRFRHGLATAVDVLQQRQNRVALDGDRIRLASRLAVAENALAVLIGQVPGRWQAPASVTLPAPPALPVTGDLATWVQDRPDLQAAFLRVHAADQRLAAAIADRLPRLSITASISTSAAETYHLFDDWLANLAVNLIAPLIDGGRRVAEVDRNRALVAERFHAYGQILLTALAEVEDALAQEQHQQDYLVTLEQRLDLSRQATRRALAAYAKGTMTYDRYLLAQIAEQNLASAVVAARRDLLRYRVALYRSLGSAWHLDEPSAASIPPSSPRTGATP